MSKPLPTQITEALGVLLETCLGANGYPSHVGERVYIGQIEGRADDAPAVWVIPGLQRQTARYGTVREVEREYSVRAFADLLDQDGWAEADEPSRHSIEIELVDQIIIDLHRCLDTWDSGSGLSALIDQLSVGSDRPGYSEDGGTRVGAGLDLTITYRVDLTDPTTPA
jgi:hypothetical protein